MHSIGFVVFPNFYMIGFSAVTVFDLANLVLDEGKGPDRKCLVWSSILTGPARAPASIQAQSTVAKCIEIKGRSIVAAMPWEVHQTPSLWSSECPVQSRFIPGGREPTLSLNRRRE